MTSRLKILLHYTYPDRLGREIHERFPNIDVHYCKRYEDIPKALEAFAPDICFSIRVAGQPGFPREALLNTKTLKWIANGGSGTDHIAPWDPEKIIITNSAGVAADVMSQYVVGAIKGAALDVFEPEPLPEESPLWRFDNVIISTHCSGVFDGWELRAISMFCDNIDRWSDGQPLRNVVIPSNNSA